MADAIAYEGIDDLSPSPKRPALCGNPSCCYAGSAFLCSLCGNWVCWCQGGSEDDYDPEGTLCCDCWDRTRREMTEDLA